jgi:hypothetical protein
VHFALIRAYVGKSFKVETVGGMLCGEFCIGVDSLDLRYGFIFWGGERERKSIFKLQKRIIRLISNEGSIEHGASKGGSCRPSPQNRNLKNTDFVDMVISKVLRDLPIGRNQLLKLADE